MSAEFRTQGNEAAQGEPGRCRLCGSHDRLQNSHVIPSFVTKWLKDTSATGFMRFGQNPNRRTQDGYKAYWLCIACERRFNEWETQFATKIFHPLNQDGARRICYDDWFIKFCTSVSWRMLLLMSENGGLADYDDAQMRCVDEARHAWAEFLLGNRSNVGEFVQHFLPLDAISDATFNDLPSNMNRYILRTIGADLVDGNGTTFSFTKMGKMIVLGFVRLRRPRQWQGTKVFTHGGVVGHGKYVLPRAFADYLASKAEYFATVNRSYSPAQREKIEASMWSNIERVARSGSFQAMHDDVRLFGKGAFAIHRPPKE